MIYFYRGPEHQAGSVDDKFCIVMRRNAMFKQSEDVATVSSCKTTKGPRLLLRFASGPGTEQGQPNYIADDRDWCARALALDLKRR